MLKSYLGELCSFEGYNAAPDGKHNWSVPVNYTKP
jgi:hypothetical protein